MKDRSWVIMHSLFKIFKTQIFALIFIFCVANVFAQNKSIEEANELIARKKYESAINILNAADPNNENPDIVIAKTNLFLNYFVSSIMHQMFALKDLEPGEELMKIRGSEGNFAMFLFSPDSTIKELIKKFPDNYKLHRTLGLYYHEVQLKYNGNWLVPDSVLVKEFHDYYLIAYDHEVFDYWSLYGIGYAKIWNGDYKNAIPYFVKSTELRDDYPSSHYNLAYAYLYTDQQEKAIESAKVALELYEYPDYKADAARIIAVIFRELDQDNKALEYLIAADTIQPDNYYTLKPMLEVEMELNLESYKNTTRQFFLLAPGNPTIYQDLMKIYWNNIKEDELLGFLRSLHEEYINDNKVNGNLYFYIGKIHYDKEEFDISKENFEKARELFKKVYEPDHRVFKVIDSYTKEI